MSESLPLSALLSRAVVAFTIELDNAWETRMPHRTTRFGGPRGAPYAVSLALWSNFMRAVPEQGVSIAELERRVRARLPLDGMRRWKYVTIAPDPDSERDKVPRRDWRITPTPIGLRAARCGAGCPRRSNGGGETGSGPARSPGSDRTSKRLPAGSGWPTSLNGSRAITAATPGEARVATASHRR